MINQKLCLGINENFDISEEQQISLFKQTGFEKYFIDIYSKERTLQIAKYAKNEGVEAEFVHGPFHGIRDLWKPGEEGERFTDYFISMIETTAQINCPIIISHVFQGFYTGEKPTDLGIERIYKILKVSKNLGVKVAFENTEGEEFLNYVFKNFSVNDNAYFCFDSGHEICYNKGKDMLSLYGDRLIALHLNDNLGVRSYDGTITWHDDLHLLPFDGIVDWNNVIKRLHDLNYNGTLTLELDRHNKPNRHNSDKYLKMSIEEYVAEAYQRACKLGRMFKND